MSAAGRQWTVELRYDPRALLEVPADARSDDARARAAWVTEAISTCNLAEEWSDDRAALSQRLEGQAGMLSEDAFAGLLHCPRGLPGDALVEVFVVDTDLVSLDQLDAQMLVAVPQRIRPVTSAGLGEGRAISSVSALPDGGVIGQIRYQFLSQGVFVETAVTSSDLSVLGAGVPLFDDLVSGITVKTVDRTGAA